MDAVGDVGLYGDGGATVSSVFDVFCVDCVLLYFEGCVIEEASVVEEDYVRVNMAVCVVESEIFVLPVIDVVLDDFDFVYVKLSHFLSAFAKKMGSLREALEGVP